MTDQTTDQDQDSELIAAQTQIAALEGERDNLAMRLHAQGSVLTAHNISFDVNKADLSALTVEDGAVSGEFAYTPPSVPKQKPQPQPQPQPQPKKEPEPAKVDGLTIEDVKAMSVDEINEKWDEVSSVLEQQGESA